MTCSPPESSRDPGEKARQSLSYNSLETGPHPGERYPVLREPHLYFKSMTIYHFSTENSKLHMPQAPQSQNYTLRLPLTAVSIFFPVWAISSIPEVWDRDLLTRFTFHAQQSPRAGGTPEGPPRNRRMGCTGRNKSYFLFLLIHPLGLPINQSP